jgi:hypothetical protein
MVDPRKNRESPTFLAVERQVDGAKWAILADRLAFPDSKANSQITGRDGAI